MNGTIGASIFYVLTYLILFSGFFIYKKTEKDEAGVTWLVMTAVLSECFVVFVAGVINLIHIPLHMVSLGIPNLAAGAFFWWKIKMTGEKQSYKWNAYDAVFAVLLLIVVGYIAHVRFGFPELHWCYKAVDPAAHYREAMEFVSWQTVSRMFFAQLINGIFIEILSPLCRYDYYYQWFVLSDILQLILCGAVFYAVVKRWCKDHFTHIAAIVASFFFLLGFPLNSTLYGFTYLIMGIYVVGALIFLTDIFLQDELKDKWLSILLLMLACHAIFQCYALFMPMTYLSIGLAFLLKQKRAGKLISLDTLKTGLEIFLLPVVLGFVYTYMDVFVNDNVTVGGALSAEGGIYRDLYSNFLFFLPIAAVGYFYLIKKKKNTFLTWMTPLFGAFTLGMFIASYKTGKVSTYYFFKNYYLLWLLVFALVVLGFSEMAKDGRRVSCYFMCSWAFVAMMFLTGLESKIEQKNNWFVLDHKSQHYNDLLCFNRDALYDQRTYSQGKMDLIHYVYGELILGEKTDRTVPALMYYEEKYLYEAMTDQRLDDFEFWHGDERYAAFLEDIVTDADYVMVYYDVGAYEEHQDYFDSLERVYETDAGFVAKTHE